MRPQHIAQIKNIRYFSTPIPNIDKIKRDYDKNKNKDGKKRNYKSSYLRMYNCLPINNDKEDKTNEKTK